MFRIILAVLVCTLLTGCGGTPRDPQVAAWEARERQAGRLVGELIEVTQADGKPEYRALVRTEDAIARGTGELAVVSVPTGYRDHWPKGRDLKTIPPGHFIKQDRMVPNRPNPRATSNDWDTAQYLLRPQGEVLLATLESQEPFVNAVPLDDGQTLFGHAKNGLWSALIIDRAGNEVLRSEIPNAGRSFHRIGKLMALSTTSGYVILDPRTLQPIPGPPLVLISKWGSNSLMLAIRDGEGMSDLIGAYGPITVGLPGRLIPYHLNEVTARENRENPHACEVSHWFAEVDGQRIGVLDRDGTVLRRDLQWAEGVQVPVSIRAAGDLDSHDGILLRGADGAWRVMWIYGDIPDSPLATTREGALQNANQQRCAYNVARINAHNQAVIQQIHADLARAEAAAQLRAEESARRARLAALGPEYRERFDAIRTKLAKDPPWFVMQQIDRIDPVIARGADAAAWDLLRRDVAQAVLDKREEVSVYKAQRFVKAIQDERDPPTALPQAALIELGQRLTSLDRELSAARYNTAPPAAAAAASGFDADAARARSEADARHRIFMAETARAISDLRR